MLIDRLRQRQSGIVLYGITPPKLGSSPEQLHDIAARQVQRLEGLPIDGLILYDLQDETPRTAEQRPFPFLETVDAFQYSRRHLATVPVPKIIYRAVGKYSAEQLSRFLDDVSPEHELSVFVGAASKSQAVSLTMAQAYELRSRLRGDLVLGAVTIPERHRRKGDEHLRVFAKIAQGCSYFVSQGVYDVNASKDFLSDYYYHAMKHELPLAPVLFTFTPCGSPKTLQFMRWLGIDIPRWLENELLHSRDILEKSVELCERNWQELSSFARDKGIPVGCNVESVAIRKVEIEASLELVRRLVALRVSAE